MSLRRGQDGGLGDHARTHVLAIKRKRFSNNELPILNNLPWPARLLGRGDLPNFGLSNQ
jgi:hypothetical protein